MTARRVALAIVPLGIAIVVGVGTVGADIEGGTFTSTEHNVRATVPRGWRVTDQATYPGVILRMYRTRPRATIIVAVDTIPAIEAACQTRSEGGASSEVPLAVQVACHQARDLEGRGFTVEPVKEAALPWFNYEDPKRQLRQGVVILGDQVATVVLAADTASGRAQYKTTFEKVLRSLRQLDVEEAAAGGAPTDAGAAPHD